jgi:outer membrane protein assembly factor BamE
MRILLMSLCLVILGGCGFVGFPGVYRIDIEQGNIVTQEMVDQLRPGMTRRQVRFILGTPLVEDTFNQDRWDYRYLLSNGLDVIRESQLTVFFEDDALTHFTGDMRPSEGPADDETAADGADDDSAA